MRIIGLIFFLIVLFLGVTFAVLNAQEVAVNYYLGTSHLPLSLLIVIVLGVGVIMGWGVGFWLWLKVKAENIRLSYRTKNLEKELNQLRTSPVQETV